MSKITYADKVALNLNEGIPDANKVKNTDMNDIKGAVNQIGAYNTVVAVTNGDFKVTLKGTLTTGDIVKISFPTATNGSSDARLSIDGGITYVNIKYENGVQAIASDIQNVEYELKYNGTDFLTINSKEKVLYNNPTGTSTTITLSETAGNFKYFQIFYRTNDNDRGFVQIFEPDGKQLFLSVTLFDGGMARAYMKNSRINISGTSITWSRQGEMRVDTGVVTANATYLFITRVVGYRA